MKIFLVIPTLKQGGAERVMSELANNFDDIGHEVHFILLAEADDFYAINPTIQVHRLGFKNKGIIQKKTSELNTFIKLRVLLNTERPDAVLCFMEKYNILTLLASRFLNLKVFVSDRSNPFKKLSLSIEILRRLTYGFAAGIVAQTKVAQEKLAYTTNHKNIRIISNPVREIKQFSNINKEKIIINVGRMVPEKGQKYLIEAFSKLNQQDWKLVILGDGALRTDLENQIEKLGLKEQVFMPGSVKNVDEWLAKASIFAFPSISEGFPNALVEAMAAGLPCVSFDCPAGPIEIIINGYNGILVDSKDANALKQEMKVLCDNEENRNALGEKATEIKEHLNPQKIALQYIEFFESVN
tara:strand:+ start:735 stop:1799 length:1065 start_codon:yes stop_codon:yes gene_type:complete